MSTVEAPTTQKADSVRIRFQNKVLELISPTIEIIFEFEKEIHLHAGEHFGIGMRFRKNEENIHLDTCINQAAERMANLLKEKYDVSKKFKIIMEQPKWCPATLRPVSYMMEGESKDVITVGQEEEFVQWEVTAWIYVIK